MSNTDITIDTILEKIENHEVWHIHRSIGSIVVLGIGGKTLRQNILTNQHLPELYRTYEPDFEIRIQCAWRLSKNDKVLHGWRDLAYVEGVQPHWFDYVINQRIVSIQYKKPAYDLTITLENDIVLDIFCDVTNEEDDDNYTIYLRDNRLTIGVNSMINLSYEIQANK